MTNTFSRRCFALLVALAHVLLGCPPANPPLAPTPGWIERREVNLVAVPGGLVDVAGGKLLVHRVDLVLDTRLGRETLGAVYDSASGLWRWSFESQYDGSIFVDESGATFTVGSLAPGAALPGTHWVKLDATRMATKGGLVHEYGADHRLAARYWRSDPYPRIVQRSALVAGAPRVREIDQCTSASACTRLFTLGRDAAGRLASVVDRAGRRAEFGWDGAGRLASARDGLDVARGWPGFRYTWSGTLLRSVTNSEGERIDYAYSGRALASATQAGPGAPVHRITREGRDGAGLYHTRFWNPLGEERRFAYDGQGRLLEQRVIATGEVTTSAWSGERRVAATLPNGATTLWTWAADDVQTRTDPSGNVVSFSYQAGGVNRDDPRVRAVAAVHDSLGPVETRSYDASGRLVELRNGAGEATRFTWSQGALASVSSGTGTRTFSQIGEHGHAERVTASGVTEQRVFDAVGNRIRGSDGWTPHAGGIEVRGFDADRNLATLELHPLSPALPVRTITLEHRSDGQVLRVLRGGNDHEFAYDAFGQPAERRERANGAWQVTRLGHDLAGRPRFQERPNGMREELDWEPGGRPAAVRRLRGGALESSLAFVYEAGELVRVEDSATGSERYVHDAAGRRVATTFADGEQLVAEWDPRSRLRAEHFVSAGGSLLTTLRYQYDLADRRIRIEDPSGPVLEAQFEDGRTAELRYGNALVRSFSYDNAGSLTGSRTVDAAGLTVEESLFEWAAFVEEEGATVLRQRATTWTWGAVEVMTIEQFDLSPAFDSAPGGARVARWHDGFGQEEVYAFDAASNLIAMGDTSFVYNAEGNRLVRAWRGGQLVGRYAYDTAGFATSRNGVPLAWSAAGRLLAHGADTFDWDGLGRLRAAHVSGVAVRFAFGGRVQADASGVPLGIDLVDVVVGFGGEHRYRHLDFRGNVKWVSDDAGRVVAHYRYAPFGVDAVFGADDDPVRFVARSEIGELMLLGERVYDPAVGRFLSPDPVFQIVNQFAYTLGNPVWFSDPDGRSPVANQAASGFDGLVGTLSLLAATFSFLGALLRFAPVPHLVVLSAILSLVGAFFALLLALALLFGKPRAGNSFVTTVSGAGGGGGGPGGGGGGGGTSGGGSGCSPGQLTEVPRLRGWLPVLLPLQLLLGFLLLRRRRQEQRQ